MSDDTMTCLYRLFLMFPPTFWFRFITQPVHSYWNDPEQTAQVMRRDEEDTLWMYTGDEGVLDNDGYLRSGSLSLLILLLVPSHFLILFVVVGRIKDIIIRGGENLFPVQIENTLTAHPGIREAAVVSVPDVRFGEVVGAWIVLDPHWGHAHFKGERKEGHVAGISKEEVKEIVAKGMNPQVRLYPLSLL